MLLGPSSVADNGQPRIPKNQTNNASILQVRQTSSAIIGLCVVLVSALLYTPDGRLIQTQVFHALIGGPWKEKTSTCDLRELYSFVCMKIDEKEEDSEQEHITKALYECWDQ